MTQEKRHTIHLLYVGVKQDREGKRITLWHKIELGENNGDPHQWNTEREHRYSGKNARLKAPVTPGSIISIEASQDETSVFPSTSRLVGLWKNEDDVTQWRAESRAIEGVIEEKERALREIKRDLPAENLAPFRAVYARLNRRQQSHLLAWVITDPRL